MTHSLCPSPPSRRTRASWLITIVACALLAGCGWRDGHDGPNVLMICIDMARYDHFMDRAIDDELTAWLDHAQVYDNAKTTAPWTMPSVASAFTGLWPVQHGAGALQQAPANIGEETPSRLDPGFTTLAEAMANAGYATGAFVEHPWFRGGFGLDQGFEQVVFAANTDNLSATALGWIDDMGGSRPWFAYLHYMDAHEKHRVSREELLTRFAGFDDATLQFIRERASAGACGKPHSRRCLRNQAYVAVLLDMRRTVAGVLDALNESGDLDDTIVVLYSDHGESFREHTQLHRSLYEDPRGMYGVGHGQAHFRQVLDIPLVVWHPAFEGERHGDLVSLVDLFPTLTHWLGLDIDTGALPGELLPPAGPIPPDRAVFASSIAFGPESLAAIDARRKAWLWPETGRMLFFDRERDPDEQAPFEDQALQQRYAPLFAGYLALQRQVDASAPDLDKDQLEALQSIGYLQGSEPED